MSISLRKNSTFAVLNATLAQLVRVPDCGSGGHGFESRRWYNKISTTPFGAVLFVFYLRKNF